MELRGGDGTEVFKALASETRTGIVALLAESPMNINALGQILGIAQPSITRHIQVLEQAGLVTSEYTPGVQGMQKVCTLKYDRFIVSFEITKESVDRTEEVEMPIGLYTLAQPNATCGLAGRDRIIGFYDDPQSFFHPERASAQLLWMADGFVEYVFPNTLPTSVEITCVELAMEICSEAPDFNNDYPSDITVWINGVDIGMWTSPGDLGGKRGRLNPPWWSDHVTQHGLLKVWSVDSVGSYVDGSLVSNATLADIRVAPKQSVNVRIGVKPNAENPGGFNLFGRGFGNYEQDLVLRLHFTGRKTNGAMAEQIAIAAAS
ncbi:MAG TPA: helix-turn-helix domain-containing protein [Armatimonadota bacterium]|jgi:predicted transcriptional regulator